MKAIRNLLALGVVGTFIWKLFRRRETSRKVTVEAPETLVVESRPKHSLASDAAGASLDTAQTVGTVSARTARTGGRGVAAAAGFVRSRLRRSKD
jgi:hypothetical protein